MLNEGIPGKNVTWMIRVSPRTPDRLLESFGTRARRSEVFETMMGACGPLNSGGSDTAIFFLWLVVWLLVLSKPN